MLLGRCDGSNAALHRWGCRGPPAWRPPADTAKSRLASPRLPSGRLDDCLRDNLSGELLPSARNLLSPETQEE